MSPGKRNRIHPIQRWSKRPQLSAMRRGRKHWIVRWVGMAKRRASKPFKAETQANAEIIYLSWADTFGRPVRSAPIQLYQLAETMMLMMCYG